jgi:hypothetical protein
VLDGASIVNCHLKDSGTAGAYDDEAGSITDAFTIEGASPTDARSARAASRKESIVGKMISLCRRGPFGTASSLC